MVKENKVDFLKVIEKLGALIYENAFVLSLMSYLTIVLVIFTTIRSEDFPLIIELVASLVNKDNIMISMSSLALLFLILEMILVTKALSRKDKKIQDALTKSLGLVLVLFFAMLFTLLILSTTSINAETPLACIVFIILWSVLVWGTLICAPTYIFSLIVEQNEEIRIIYGFLFFILLGLTLTTLKIIYLLVVSSMIFTSATMLKELLKTHQVKNKH